MSTPSRADARVCEHKLDAQRLLDPVGTSVPAMTLLVNHSRRASHLVVTGLARPGMVFPLADRSVPDDGEIRAMVSDLRTSLAEYSSAEGAGDLEQTARMNLRAKGHKVFQVLFTEDARAAIKGWADGTVLTISSNENWIPWELLCDGATRFLSERFRMYRLPHRTTVRDAGAITLRNSRDLSAIVHVVGPGLEEWQADIEGLLASPPAEVLFSPTVGTVIAKLPLTDLLHVTCHGYPSHLRISGQEAVQFNLTVGAVGLDDVKVKPGSVVFVNACESTASAAIFDHFDSFGAEFFHKGAAVYIGTLGKVSVQRAVAFANAFYCDLRTSRSIAHAFEQARLAQPRIAMLYAFYGDPDSLQPVKF